ncbi:MAG: hypothetical protein WCS43_16655 [Verrucomicrobiota bacterium]
MKLLHFVSGSAVVLAAWLAVTFVYHVPAQRYLKLDKYPTVSESTDKSGEVVAAPAKESAGLQLSDSR